MKQWLLTTHLIEMSSGNADTEEALIQAVKTTPIIDNHAHPMLKVSAIKKYPLLSITTEAHGDALADARKSLSHFRAVKQLSVVLKCDATWEAVEEAIKRKQLCNYDAWVKRCLSGLEIVLVDDGLDNGENVEPYTYFDRFTNIRAKRIIRLEQVAADIIEHAFKRYHTADGALGCVIDTFQKAMSRSLADADVVGFKSVICYRTGLEIPRTMDLGTAVRVLKRLYEERKAPGGEKFTRLNHPGLSEYFVHRLACLIRDSGGRPKPIQFHTGLGDNDITLTKSSPAHLQEFIREYPTVPIVLLHAGYPYTREIAFLATVYSNVYADIGEVFPCLSRHGQEEILRNILELCPGSKILFSTDGHWFPETFFLAVEQIRSVLLTVLSELVRAGDLSWIQAINMVKDILFNNSNKLYRLKLPMRPPARADGMGAGGSFLDLQTLINYCELHKGEVRWLRVCWNDMTATPRMRAIPMRRVLSLLRDGEDFSFGITKASLGLLQNDHLAPGVTATGEHRLHPDLKTLRPGPRKGHATVMGDFKEKDGSLVQFCPRSVLKRTLEKALRQGLTFVLGFEIELVLVRRNERNGEALRDGESLVAGEGLQNRGNKYDALDGDGHAWSAGRAMEHDAAASVLEEAILQLDAAGVYIEMLHAESANGQYEVILPKAPALEAVDILLYAREVLSSCAASKGFRMTLHPKPFAMACGTAAHVHISISSTDGQENDGYFYAGILRHLRAIAAFTYSNPVSYERVQDGCWAGGTWVAWGTQNRETPLRKIEGSHWELKCMDGLANPYLALSAIILSGLKGVADEETLIWGDCQEDPASLSEAQREELKVQEKLPASLQEALVALKDDKELCELLGDGLVERYIAVKTAEMNMIESMEDSERRQWIMERY